MTKKPTRSPAEKKALSYAKDRRNCYRANDKASRKLIPLNKAKGHRKVRRHARQQVDLIANDTLPEVHIDLAENALVKDLGGKGRWSKAADISLRELIEKQKARQEFRKGRKERSRKARDCHRNAGLSDIIAVPMGPPRH